MKKQTRALVEIGILYLSVSIVLDYFLGAYQILLWPALALEFIVFGTMMISTLWERVAPRTGKRGQSVPQVDAALTRLEHLCKMAIAQGDQTAEDLLSERVRSLAFAAAANHFNTSETPLGTIAQAQPNVFDAKIRDPQLFNALNTKGSMIRRGDTQTLERLLAKIEEWTT